ncbi:MAG: hypothetical protein KGY99_07240 [Phycisphaerae bacterium]|nr:hypothetical protein [Phycisphaerae bacterium]
MPDGALVLPLAECHDPLVVGGKAINLARLLAAGFPVPSGFVVTTNAYRACGGGPIDETVAEAIRQSYRRIGSPVVAVRSSATAEDTSTASMAGQYETLLDVQGEDQVLDAVAHCWGSIDSDRTRSYLAEQGIDMTQVAMAVVVQELVPSDVAGVLFTANPRTGSQAEMLIEASWGLGEAVVSGIVQPDTLVVDRATGAVTSVAVGEKREAIMPGTHERRPVADERRNVACLRSEDVRDLWRLGLRVMEHFGSAQDVEWAIADGKVYLLQSRAVTTLEDAEAYERRLQQTREDLRRWKRDGRGDWVRHNISETLPHPTPLTWSVIKRFMSGDGGFGSMYRQVGFEPSPAVSRDGFLDRVGGRVYMDLSRAPDMFFEDFPFEYDLDLLQANPDAAQGPPTIPAGSLRQRMRVAGKLAEINERLEALSKDHDRTLDEQDIPEFSRWVDAEKARDLTALSEKEWFDLWHERERRVMDEFAPQSLLPSLIAAMAMENLRSFLAENVWQEDPNEVVNLLSAGGAGDQTILAGQGLYEIARGGKTVEDWLADHGHRAPAEFDLAAPRWRERPEAVQSMVSRLSVGDSPAEMHERRAAEARAKADEIAAKLPAKRRQEFRHHVDVLQRYVRFREDGKYHLMRGYELLREMALEAGRRLEVGEDVFLLTFEELRDAMSTGFAPLHLIENRRIERAAEAKLVLPNIIGEQDIAELGEPPRLDSEARHAALPISSGLRSGPARIVFSPDEAGDLGEGYVLVCPSTDPSWTPLFVNAAGLIIECGGTLSHGAVVAREMGIPAVVLPNATQLLSNGETVTVDGRDGGVFRGTPDEAAEAAPSDATEADEQDPTDTHVPFEMIPPVAGRRERTVAEVRNWFLLLWGVYLVGVFLLPGQWLYEGSMTALDAVLWPVVVGWSKGGVVIVLAAVLATLTMVGQRFLTDNTRLRVAKQRAGRLRKLAGKLPRGCPRRRQLERLAGPVQARIVGAAMLPLALILGPMIMSFVWLPGRIAPDVSTPHEGEDVTVTAVVLGDYTGDVTITPPEQMPLKRGTPSQSAPDLREGLKLVARRLRQGPGDDKSATDLGVREALADQLLRLNDNEDPTPLPPQSFTWDLSAPRQRGRYPITVQADVGKPVTVTAAMGAGEPPAPPVAAGWAELPPEDQPEKADGEKKSDSARKKPKPAPLMAVKLSYSNTYKTKPPARYCYLIPPEPWAKGWWLTVYLAVYLAGMFLWRTVLRIA